LKTIMAIMWLQALLQVMTRLNQMFSWQSWSTR